MPGCIFDRGKPRTSKCATMGASNRRRNNPSPCNLVHTDHCPPPCRLNILPWCWRSGDRSCDVMSGASNSRESIVVGASVRQYHLQCFDTTIYSCQPIFKQGETPIAAVVPDANLYNTTQMKHIHSYMPLSISTLQITSSLVATHYPSRGRKGGLC